MPSRTSLVHSHVWGDTFGIKILWKALWKSRTRRIDRFLTAFYQCVSNQEYEEKNLRLHRSWALTFHCLQLGLLTSTVERVSQNKQWLIRSRLSGQVQWSDPVNTRTRKNRQALRGAGWGQELRKQWSHQGL